ncbi:hypothetical protein [Flavobacterium urocaniciphilum]|uniref:Uncharacterized protein n=1 Tax=Flavobacterium urocaniciphilum TaxID=1299341 RepID=A0A1H9DS63_9FLAO|nr:hypothetical protein [Flavobacterium urocaniciphilum]SEQ15538.1 hypothetical protein SAMN05444005_1084 [Flavobacterium urocaniciphilum]
MKNYITIILLFCAVAMNAQVGVGTNNPDATLDVNGTLAIRSVDYSATNPNALIIGSDNKVYKRVLPIMLGFQRMQIPVCNSVNVGSTGSFVQTVNGVNYTISWRVIIKGTGTAANLPATERAQRLQVRYDFSPALPFTPSALFMTGYSEVATNEVTFALNYANVSANSLTVNIVRTEMNSAESPASNCWSTTNLFDLMFLYQ